MSATQECREQAHQILDLLPTLRHWVTGRVQAAGADLGISVRQYAAMRDIRGGAASPGELARLWQVTPAVITGIVDRLEKRELVRREPDPDDRRRLRLALTETGHAASEVVERALVDDLAAQLATAPPARIAELERSLGLLHETFATLDERITATPQGCADDEPPAWMSDDAIANPDQESDPIDPRGRPLVAMEH
jgi:DNA-binding MarR family transcriptional regulator